MSDGERSFQAAPSVCPYCGVGCSLQYNEQTGKAMGWKGPVNRKGEICPKGGAAWEMIQDEDRLTQPLVRENGRLVTASWEEALSRVVEAFSGIVETDGAESLVFFASSNCTNEENYLLGKVARLLGTNSVDNCARLCHSSTVAAMGQRFGAGAMTNTLDDLVLTTGRVLQHFNSGALTRRSGTLKRMRAEDVLQIHPDDAAARGVEDGDTVEVRNDRGSVTLAAEVTPAIRRGTVFATFHYADPLVNRLTGDELDPVAKIPEYKHSAVRVTVIGD